MWLQTTTVTNKMADRKCQYLPQGHNINPMSWPALSQVLESIGYPPILLQLTKSFHDEMKFCVQFDGNTSGYFDVRYGVGNYYAALPRWALIEGVYIRTRLDGFLFNLQAGPLICLLLTLITHFEPLLFICIKNAILQYQTIFLNTPNHSPNT